MNNNMTESNIIIIGGGIVGLATAYTVSLQYPDLHITLLEKEDELSFHQSGRNSGVLHSGIYYKPGSLKARNCRSGKVLMEQFCTAESIPFQLCGKVIVATQEEQRPALHDIFARGQANGVDCELIDRPRLQEIEPYTAGIDAIYIPESGIVDYKRVCLRMAEILESKGHEIVTGAEVIAVREQESGVTAETTMGDYQGRLPDQLCRAAL